MKKKLARILALTLAAMMVLTACGDGGKKDDGGKTDTPPASTDGETPSTPDETPGEGETPSGGAYGSEFEPVKDFVTYGSAGNDMSTFLVFGSENANELDPLSNCLAYMLEVDNHGKMHAAAAKEWGTEDNGLTWTFKLRDDIVWVDVNGNEKAKTVAHDWLTGLEWVLNFHKNGGANTSMPNLLVKGAQEYYDYTHDLDEAEALALSADNGPFLEMVGIEAPDDYTVIYHCTKNAPYFQTLGTHTSLRPLSQAQVDEMGVEGVRTQDNTNMWYNGPYTITEYIQGNTKTLTKNPAYWDKDCYLFDTVTYLMVEDALQAQNLFMNGDIDWCNLSESNLRSIYEDPNGEWYPYLVEARPASFSYQFHLNYAQNKEDGTPDDNWNNAAANDAFRKSLFYGMDLTKYWARTNFINPGSCENVAYTMKDMMYYPDGRDYVQKVWELLGYDSGRYDAEKGKQYKEQAMQELAGKVEFPVVVDHYIAAGNQDALDTATVLKEIVESLGTEYITMNIKTFINNGTKEVYTPKLQSWVVNGWGADYRDPENFIGQELYGDDAAFYSNRYSNINDATDPELIAVYQEFTELGKKASGIFDDLTKRYDAYAEAEVFMLEHALVIPCHYRINWKLTKSNDYDYMSGYKNYHTSTEPYTTEQYEQFKTDFYANR